MRYRQLLEDFAERLSPDTSLTGSVNGGIRYSILLPVYKVEVEYLSATIESVFSQTYRDWELCIVDDASQSEDITRYLKDVSLRDPARIKLHLSEVNCGISGATNTALSMATGSFVCLLDHDDLLSRDALAAVYDVAKSDKFDLIYSDECKVDIHGIPGDLFLKPDWDPYLLHNMMYTGHFSVYRATTIRNLGGFRSEFDLSQDYDLALRFAEQNNRVHHLPKVLYGWRSIPASAASGGKPHARRTNVAALQDAMRRRGLAGEAVALPTANRMVLDRTKFTSECAIIIPSDNPIRIRDSINSIRSETSYKNYKIFVVTRSAIVRELEAIAVCRGVEFVPYDKPFNFSDKCNAGAAAARGFEYLIFYNDDVFVKSKDWLQSILDYLLLPGVAAVGPKLLYEDGTIQHAGMVTGVRRLFGTAFHCMPGDTPHYFNFAQSVRQVSVLCGACIAVKREIFDNVDGFDDVRFPIAHSDGDLCFKLRRAGFACIYTPHAELIHTGHSSIGQSEHAWSKQVLKRDPADAYMLGCWPEYVAYDPFYPPVMSSVLFRDSQEAFSVFPGKPHVLPSAGRRVLIISHDLSESGAPRVTLLMAKALSGLGHFVVVACPTDGPIRQQLVEAGITVVVDELLLREHDSVPGFASSFDVAIANTVATWPFVRQCGAFLPVAWYIHETEHFKNVLNASTGAREAVDKASTVWAGSVLAQAAIAVSGGQSRVLPYGIERLPAAARVAESRKFIRISVFGSFEPRKGQDLAIKAFRLYRQAYDTPVQLFLAGRVLDTSFYSELKRIASGLDVEFGGELTFDDYVQELHATDVMLVSSRSDTLPLVSLHALQLGKVMICSKTVGTSAYVEEGQSGFVTESPAPDELMKALAAAIDCKDRWDEIGMRAQAVFRDEFGMELFADRLGDELVGLKQKG